MSYPGLQLLQGYGALVTILFPPITANEDGGWNGYYFECLGDSVILSYRKGQVIGRCEFFDVTVPVGDKDTEKEYAFWLEVLVRLLERWGLYLAFPSPMCADV